MRRTCSALLLFVACALLAQVCAAKAPYNCEGVVNKKPVVTRALDFVKKVSHGKLYKQNGVSPPVSVVHLYGTPYQMGYAHGQLMKNEIEDMRKDFHHFIYEQAMQYFHTLPPVLQRIFGTLGEEGVEVALDLEHFATAEYTPQHYKDEIQGMADGLGWTYEEAIRLQMFPELIQAACSMAGAWGSAIPKAGNGTLYQLRALDWATNGPFQQYPVVLVYHPEAGNGHAFSTATWAGLLGALTGFSSAPFAVCEKVWLHYKGPKPRFGTPWMFVLRDILQYDDTVQKAEARIAAATRTCSIFVGLGSTSKAQGAPDFNVVRYSHWNATVWNNANSANYTNHPKMNDLIYVNKHTQPSEDKCMGALLQAQYGNIDAHFFRTTLAPLHETGSTHLAVFDFAQRVMYLANAGVATPSGGAGEPAYNRASAKYDMDALFAEKL